MAIPTPWSVGVRRFETSGTDAHGNPTETHSATVLSLPVHFVSPVGSAGRFASVEPFRENRDLLTTDLLVGAPTSDDLPTSRDLVVWNEEDYRVEGAVADFTRGPWDHPDAGVTFIIRRVEG
jgi:hypothetical protein